MRLDTHFVSSKAYLHWVQCTGQAACFRNASAANNAVLVLCESSARMLCACCCCWNLLPHRVSAPAQDPGPHRPALLSPDRPQPRLPRGLGSVPTTSMTHAADRLLKSFKAGCRTAVRALRLAVTGVGLRAQLHRFAEGHAREEAALGPKYCAFMVKPNGKSYLVTENFAAANTAAFKFHMRTLAGLLSTPERPAYTTFSPLKPRAAAAGEDDGIVDLVGDDEEDEDEAAE